jgi:hypothetical protein
MARPRTAASSPCTRPADAQAWRSGSGHAPFRAGTRSGPGSCSLDPVAITTRECSSCRSGMSLVRFRWPLIRTARDLVPTLACGVTHAVRDRARGARSARARRCGPRPSPRRPGFAVGGRAPGRPRLPADQPSVEGRLTVGACDHVEHHIRPIRGSQFGERSSARARSSLSALSSALRRPNSAQGPGRLVHGECPASMRRGRGKGSGHSKPLLPARQGFSSSAR